MIAADSEEGFGFGSVASLLGAPPWAPLAPDELDDPDEAGVHDAPPWAPCCRAPSWVVIAWTATRRHSLGDVGNGLQAGWIAGWLLAPPVATSPKAARGDSAGIGTERSR